MPEDNNAGGTDQNAGGGQVDDNNAGGGSTNGSKLFSQADLDRIVADRVKRERDKYSDYGDLKKFKQSAMTDQEKALQEAEAKGRTGALVESGARLARAELKAAAAGKVPAEQLDGFLEFADMAKFVGADGEPDTKAIEAAVKKLAPDGNRTNFDGGARTSGQTTDMNALIRRQAGLG